MRSPPVQPAAGSTRRRSRPFSSESISVSSSSVGRLRLPIQTAPSSIPIVIAATPITKRATISIVNLRWAGLAGGKAKPIGVCTTCSGPGRFVYYPPTAILIPYRYPPTVTENGLQARNRRHVEPNPDGTASPPVLHRRRRGAQLPARCRPAWHQTASAQLADPPSGAGDGRAPISPPHSRRRIDRGRQAPARGSTRDPAAARPSEERGRAARTRRKRQAQHRLERWGLLPSTHPGD